MTRPALVRRALAAAVLPLALGSLSACSSDDEAGAKDSSSASSSSSSSSDTPSAGETVSPADFTDRFESGFENTTTAHETMTLSGGGGSFQGEGDVDYTQDSPAMTMTMSSDQMGGSMEIRLVDRVIYMKIPGMAGGKYVKMDLNDPNSPFGSLGSQLDPQEALKTFGQGIKSVTYVGDEDGLGHYRVTVDTKKMLAQMKESGAAAQAGLPDELTYDVWLDDQDRVTRMTMDLGQTGTMEMELSDFGKDVSIEAPPASQVTDMNGLRMAG